MGLLSVLNFSLVVGCLPLCACVCVYMPRNCVYVFNFVCVDFSIPLSLQIVCSSVCLSVFLSSVKGSGIPKNHVLTWYGFRTFLHLFIIIFSYFTFSDLHPYITWKFSWTHVTKGSYFATLNWPTWFLLAIFSGGYWYL